MESCPAASERRFGPAVSNCAHRFDFTLLFEETILFILPLGLTFCLALARIVYLFRRNTVTQCRWPFFTRIAAYIALVATQCAFLITVAVGDSTKTSATFAAGAVGVAAFPILGLQSLFEYRKTFQPPTTIILYFLATVPMNVVRCRTLYSGTGDAGLFATYLVFSILSVITLAIELFDKRKHIHPSALPASTEQTADVVQRSFLAWIYTLFRTGWKKPLALGDLISIDSGLLKNRLRSFEDKALSDSHGKHGLLLKVFKTHASLLMQPVLPRLCYVALTFAQPFLVKTATSYVEDQGQKPNYNTGGGLIAAYFIVYVGIAVMLTMYQQKSVRAATAIRTSLVSSISCQVLRLDVTTAQSTSAASLISANVNSIQMGFRRLHETWSCLVATAVALWLLAEELGVSVTPTAVLAFVLIASSLILSLQAGPRQKTWFEATARRVAATSAILTHMKGIKLMGIGKRVHAMLSAARTTEIKRSQSFRMFLIFITALSYAATALAPAFGLGIHVVIARNGHSNGLLLNSATAFSSLTLLSLVTSNITEGIQSVLSFFTMLSCLERIQKFLNNEQIGDSRLLMSQSKEPHDSREFESAKDSSHTTMDDDAFSLTGVCAKYDEKSGDVLRDITCTIAKAGVTLIVGPTGSGKSTLIKILLGDGPLTSGEISCRAGPVAYAPQAPWIMNATLKDNIIGPNIINQRRYEQILRACGLDGRMAGLPNGDLTPCGPNGNNLSGGQKKRVAMARAIYASSPVTLLDDCMSGLDATTQAHVMSALLGKESPANLESSALIFTSTNPTHARWADQVIYIDSDGCQVDKSNLEVHDEASANSSDNVPCKESLPTKEKMPVSTMKKKSILDAKKTTDDGGTYKYYINIVGIWQTSLFLLLCTVFVVALIYPQIYLRSWALFSAAHQRATVTTLLGVYFGLAFAALAFYVVATTFFMLDMAERSSERFHRVLLDVTLGTQLQNAGNPGATINRFSQDLQQIDRPLPINFVTSAIALLQALGSIAVIIVGSPYSGIAIPAIGLAIGFVQVIYLRTSRRLRILELEVVAPLFSHLNEALQGLTTIRALGWTKMYYDRFLAATQRAQIPFYLLAQAQNTLNLVLDLITAVTAVIVISVGVGTLPGTPGLGLALFSVVTFGQAIKTFVQTWTMLEISLGAVGRIRQYQEETTVEKQDGHSPPSGWPLRGSIGIEGLSIVYEPSTGRAIDDVNLHIPEGSKVGICGHTGSGKSTLIASLLRLVDYESGSIRIDNLDITTVKQDDLRSSFAVLPQDPVLLPISLRDNMNLFKASTDNEIWTSLKAVGMDKTVEDRGGLDTTVKEASLSDGELKLLCVARLMLQSSSIVILDEPTSSLDSEIQETVLQEITRKFKASTLLCVAHRLDTIMDFDLIVVMEGGKIVETGKPRDLLQAKRSKFSALYESYTK